MRARAHDLVATSQEFLHASWAAAAGGGQAPIDLGAAAYRTLGDVRTHALGRGSAWWSVVAVRRSTPEPLDPAAAPLRTETGEIVSRRRRHRPARVETLALDVRAADAYRGDTEAAVADIAGLVRGGRCVVLVTEGHGPGARLVEVLGDHDVAARFVDELDPTTSTGCRRREADGVVQVAQGSLAPRLRRRGHQPRRAHRRRPHQPAHDRRATRAGCRRGAAGRSTRSS